MSRLVQMRILMLGLLCSGNPVLADSKPLQGHVQSNLAKPRISRPLPTAVGVEHNSKSLEAALQSSGFDLKGTKDNTAPPVLDSGLNVNTIPASASFSPEREVKPVSKREPSGGGGSAQPATAHASGASQLIIVRLTYHMLDEQNVFNAATLCHSLITSGCSVILMLDKEATRITNRHLNTQVIMRKESRAKTVAPVITDLLNSGVRVVASKEWAEDYGINDGNAINGVEFLDTDEFAAEIIKSTKIMEY